MMSFVAPVLGLMLGATLINAGVRKRIAPTAFASALTALMPEDRASFRRHGIITALPWIEIGCGTASCLLFDSMIVRTVVLVLFMLFLVALVRLAVRLEQFTCGCFGSDRMERRNVVVARGVIGLLLAFSFLKAPLSERAVTSYGMLWFYGCNLALLLLHGVVIQARELKRLANEGDIA